MFIWLALLQAAPDYAISSIRPATLSADGGAVMVAFDVTNAGAAASTSATVRMVNKDTGTELATEQLGPLAAGEGVVVTLEFPVGFLPPDRAQTMLVSVGINEVETSTSPGIANNSANVIVPPPNQLPTASPVQQNEPGQSAGSLFILGFEFNRNDPVHVVALIGISGALLIMVVLLVIILRLLFQRKPRFSVQLPPYANAQPLSTATNAGRRQGWQFHAQNDLAPPLPANEGATHVRKRLTGVNGIKFSDWKITGLRLSQYDQYGRVTRSEVIADRKFTRRLSAIAHKAPDLTEDRISRRVRPISRALVGRFKSRVNKRSAMLPLALDLSFEGEHGEVRILFELYYLEQGRWRKVDHWEPDMMVPGKAIHENFTFSMTGMRQGETFRDFMRRLPDDLTQILTNMLKADRQSATESGEFVQQV
jgi:hypothetical protein